MADFNPFQMPDNGATDAPPTPAPPTPAPPTPAQPKAPSAIRAGARQFFGKTPRRVLIPSAIIVALLLVFIFAGNAIMVRIAPAWSIGRATVKTTQAIEDRFNQSPYKVVGLFWNAVLHGTIDVQSTYETDWDAGYIDLRLQTDLKNGALLGNLAMDGYAKRDVQFYLSRENAAVSSSALEQAWVGMTYETFEADLRASALLDTFGMSEEMIREAADTVKQISDMFGRDYEKMLTPYSEITKDFAKNLEFEFDTAKTRVGGKSTNCARISVEISEKQVRGLIRDMTGMMVKDESLRDMLAATLMANVGYTRAEAMQEASAQLRGMQKSVAAGMANIMGDLTIEYYLYQNQLVKLVLEGDFTVDEERLDFACTLDFGRDPSKDGWDMTCEMTTAYDTVSLALVYESAADGKKYEDELTVSVSQYDETLVSSVRSEWDKATGDLEMTLIGDGVSEMLTCNLLMEKNGFTATVADLAALPGEAYVAGSFALHATTTADKITAPTFQNLDQWDTGTIQTLMQVLSGERAVIEANTDG